MNRRLFEEVIDFSKQRISNFLIIFSLLFIPGILLAQTFKKMDKILLNGFGRYEYIKTDEELFNVFASDLNLDGNIDLGGLDKSGRNLFIYFGKRLNKIDRPIKYTFSEGFSGLTIKKLNLDDKPNLILWSKLSGKIEIFSISVKSLRKIKSIKIDCCFSEIIPVNIDHTKELELIVYGPNYNGIDVISLRSEPIRITRVSDGFHDLLVPLYLNSDDKLDFVTFSNLKKELYLFRNNSNLNFSKNAFSKFNKNYHKFLVGNYDDDGLNDLAMINNNDSEVKILYGNGIGGFDRISTISREGGLSQSISYDYNRDLIDDFIFYSKENHQLTLELIEGKARFRRLPLIEVEKLNSISNYLTTTTKGILFSTSTGLNLIYYSSLPDYNQTYALSAQIVSLGFLNKSSDYFNKLIWIDKGSQCLNILIRNEFNTPEEIYSIKLSSAYDNLKVLSDDGRFVKVVCFSLGKYFSDYFIFDFHERSFTRKVITVDGNIFQIGLDYQKKDLLTVIAEKGEAIKVFVINPFAVNQLLLSKQLSVEKPLAYVFDFSNRKFLELVADKDLTYNLIAKDFESSFERFNEYSLTKLKYPKALDYKLYICENSFNQSIVFLNFIGLNESILYVLRTVPNSSLIEIQNSSISNWTICKCAVNSYTKDRELVYINDKTNQLERVSLSIRNRLLRSALTEDINHSIRLFAVSNLPEGEIAYTFNYSLLKIKRLRR